ncbi:MAG: hypothetical protein ACXABV_04280 [Candidatus Thorarchaeota archaeon]
MSDSHSLSGRIKPEDHDENVSKLRKITLLMFVLAIAGPAAFSIGVDFGSGFGWQIMAMTWWLSSWGQMPIVIVDPYVMASSLLLFTLRPVFAYQTIRYYRGYLKKDRALLYGLASELQILVVVTISLMMAFIQSPDPSGILVPLYLPIPILFLVGLKVMNVSPVEKATTPWKQSGSDTKWWTSEAKPSESHSH